MNLAMLLQMAAEGAPPHIAVGSRDDGLTYQDLYHKAGSTAGGLQSRGAARLLYADEASPALPLGLFASAWAGMPFVPVSYRLADDRLRAIVESQAPAVLLHQAGGDPRLSDIAGIEMLSTAEFLDRGGESTEADDNWHADGEGPAVLLHTSGPPAHRRSPAVIDVRSAGPRRASCRPPSR